MKLCFPFSGWLVAAAGFTQFWDDAKDVVVVGSGKDVEVLVPRDFAGSSDTWEVGLPVSRNGIDPVASRQWVAGALGLPPSGDRKAIGPDAWKALGLPPPREWKKSRHDTPTAGSSATYLKKTETHQA